MTEFSTLDELFDACKQKKAQEKFEANGYTILRDIIPKEAIDAAVRLIYKDLFDYGISSREIVWWRNDASWFPHLRFAFEITDLIDFLPIEYLTDYELAEPQILLAPPDTSKEYELTPHIDEPPEWAGGRNYLHIVGVPLTPHSKTQGGVKVWPFNSEPVVPELEPGDVLAMHPELPHSGVPNLQGGPRLAVYFRFLEV